MTIMLSGSDLTVMQVVAVARLGEAVALAPAARRAVRQARAVVQEVLQTQEPAADSMQATGWRTARAIIWPNGPPRTQPVRT
jgi:ABC-type sulfate transport system permease component